MSLKNLLEKYCILPYPKAKNLRLDQEEQINELLYRDKETMQLTWNLAN